MKPGLAAVAVADQLKRMRRSQQLRQGTVAEALNLSAGAISRIERGHRGLSMSLLFPWARALMYRAELVFWEPVAPPDKLDAEARMLLADVAASLPHMPAPARKALAHEMQLWRESASS